MPRSKKKNEIKFKLKKLKLINFEGKDGENYKVTGGKLGQGGGGNVYRCENSKGKKLALKIFTRIKEPFDEHLARFINEIEFSINSEHPNVLKAIDQGEISYESFEHLPFYVMPEAKCDLRKYSKDIDLKDNYDEFRRILFEVIEGLIYIHEKGKNHEDDEEINYHRDIKPENILIMRKNNRAVVSDFGIAHLREELQIEDVETDPENIPKNRKYYAPEENPDYRFDIFSLGYVIYEILTGEMPRGTGQRISDKNQSYKILFDIIIDKMIRQDPNERNSSFQEVKIDLKFYYENDLKELEIPFDRMSNKERSLFLILMELDEDIGNHFIMAITTLRNTSLPSRFIQSAHSFSFICKFLNNLKENFFKNVEILPERSEERKTRHYDIITNLCNFFSNIANGRTRTNKEEFEDKFQEFQLIISEILKSNLIILNELDKLIKKETPVPKDIDVLFQSLNKPTHSQYFFTRLSSPKWFNLLLENSFFIEPRTKVVEGTLMVSIWPQVNYLMKISSERPEDVFSIIQSLSASKNYKIYWPLLECLCNMPVDVSQKGIPIIKKWMSYFISIPILAKIMDLIRKFLDEGEGDKVFEILSIILSVDEPEIKNEYDRFLDKFYFIFTKYNNIREKLINIDLTKNSSDYLETLCQSLSKYLENEYTINNNFKDYSEIWKPSIEVKSSENGKNQLVDEIIIYLEQIAAKDIDALKSKFLIISKYKWVIFIRIQLYLLKTYFHIFTYEIESYLINFEIFEDDIFWKEYSELLKQNYTKISLKSQEKILDWIKNGPNYSRWGITLEDFENQDEFEQYKERSRIDWVKKKAKPIENVLPSKIKEVFDKITPKIERVKLQRKEELNSEEIKNLEVEELIGYLVEHPEKANLGYLLRDVIIENPSKYIGLLLNYLEITFYYIKHIIDGFTRATQKSEKFDIEECTLIMIQISKGYLGEEKLLSNFSLLRVLISYFRECLALRTIKLKNTLLTDIWVIILLFLTINEPRTRAQDPNYRDHVNFSINTYTGSVILLIISYALHHAWISNLPPQHRMVPEVKEKFEEILDPKHNSARIIWSIISYKLYSIFYLDEQWAVSKLPIIFIKENQALWLIAWESYISYNQLNSKIYSHLKSEYIKTIEMLVKNKEFSNESLEGLSSHMALAYIFELEDLAENSLITSFLYNASSKMRSKMMYYTFKIYLDDKNKIEEEKLLKRILYLWEYLIDYLKQNQNLTVDEIYNEIQWYGQLFRKIGINQKYIDLLNQVLELSDGNLGSSTIFIFDILKKYIELNPKSVLNVVEKLLIGNVSTWLFEKSVNDIIEIVKLVNEKYNLQEFVKEITKIEELMTEKGFYELHEAIKTFNIPES